MNVYQQETMDAVISGLTEYYPQLKLKSVRERIGNNAIVPESGNRQQDYENARTEAEHDILVHEKADTALLIIDSYPYGKCPDCFEYIPKDVVEGGECRNCGHVFTAGVE